MKSITKEFLKKIQRNGGILETKQYRYAIVAWQNPETGVWSDRVERISLDCVGTTAMLDKGNWEVVAVREARK